MNLASIILVVNLVIFLLIFLTFIYRMEMKTME